MGGQEGQKFECNDKHIDIQNRLRESRKNSFTRLPLSQHDNCAVPQYHIVRAVTDTEKSRIAPNTQEREKIAVERQNTSEGVKRPINFHTSTV